MEKRTLLAVVLSVVVLSVFYIIQGRNAPPAPPPSPEAPAQPSNATQPPNTANVIAEAPPVDIQSQGRSGVIEAELDNSEFQEKRVTIETDLVIVTFTNAGGDIVSYKLKEHREGDSHVEMILGGIREPHAFTVAFGGLNAQPVQSLFSGGRVSSTAVEFYRDFTVKTSEGRDGVFRLTKRYDFIPNEYMFQLTITMDGGYSMQSLDFSGAAYTLAFGPQIGPRFEKLDRRDEFRHYYTFADRKRHEEKPKDNTTAVIKNRITWAAIAGKYFTFVALPDSTSYETAFSTISEPGLSNASRFYMTRPALNTSKAVDTYRFYLGPKAQGNLGIYDNANNAYKYRDLQLSTIASTSGILAPLEWLLKQLLQLCYKMVGNYGIAIMLLTLFVKVVLFPFTKKSSESTLRMQALSPKIKEIQEKYKSNPAKMNAEMSGLYKKEGYNPLSGCLPLLIQFPIIIAMYNLFNTHFDLRGAEFISGWIPDLSRPEYIYSFAPAMLPFLGWSEVRLLPFIYLASQMLYGKVTQTPDQKANSQMKMMLYFMPIVFFFVLYNMPSGLLLYWILSNLLTLVQQLALNKYLARKKAAAAAADAPPVIAPPRGPRRRK